MSDFRHLTDSDRSDFKLYTENSPFWKLLTVSEQELIQKNCRIHSYKKGDFIHGSDSSCLGMVFVLSGTLRLYLLSEQGREITLFRLYEKESCALSASCAIRQITFDTQMTADEDTRLLVIGTGILSRITEKNLAARCYVYELLIERFSSVMWTMQQILFQGYDKRLASFLLQEYDRTGSPVILMTHEQIAQHTSSAREVTARMLKRFSSDHLVSVGRGSIRLTDPAGLRRIL